jgi:hypothetical protein
MTDNWTRYDDIGTVLELEAVYDDVLKKDKTFTDWAVMVANKILLDLGVKALATYGKWGARLEPAVNPHLSKVEIERIGKKILEHPSWKALKESTYVFTYGNTPDEISEYQQEAEKRAEETAKAAHEYVKDLFKKPFKIEAPDDCLNCMENLTKSIDDCRKCSRGPQLNVPISSSKEEKKSECEKEV